MSSIHYKFRAELDYKTLQFDGLHIRGEQLVREISSKENLKLELFELQLQNAHTKKTYSDDELIPRNSSIIVQRFPRKDAAKVQKVQAGVNSGIVSMPDGSSLNLDSTSHISTVDFENMDETERLNHIRDQSTRAYDSSNFRRRPQGIMTGPPPPTYTCNRCYQPGHWYKNCPMLNTKRTTGIPSQELMETTADDPAAMLHPSGKYVVPIMHWKARQETLAKKSADVESSSSPSQLDRKVPVELLCPLCHSIFKEAVVTSCCGNSYCAECIEQRIIDPDSRKCPGTNCGNTEISIESLIPNRTLRDAAAAWHNLSVVGALSAQSSQEPEQIRIRIGLKAPITGVGQSTVPPSAISPVSSLPASSTVIPHHAMPVVPQAYTNFNSSVSTLGLAQNLIPSSGSASNVQNLIQDVSLPPPNLRSELPGIPGVTTGGSGLGHFGQPPPVVPGIPGLSAALQQPAAAMISAYGMHMFTPGFPPAASVLPRVPSSGIEDGWYQNLRSSDSYNKRGIEKREHAKDRERTRRKEKKDPRSRRRRESSSSTVSSLSSSSVEEERLRRKKREKGAISKRRSVEKERQRRSDEYRRSERDRGRDRERGRQRDRDAKNVKDMKTSSSRVRDRIGSSVYEDQNKEEKRKVETVSEDVLKDRRKTKDIESKDEDEIDGIIAEYGKTQIQEDSGDLTKCDDLEEEQINEPSLDSTVSTTPFMDLGNSKVDEDAAVDEDPIEQHLSIDRRDKSKQDVNQAMETSEAEVVEPIKEHQEDTLEQKERDDEKKGRESPYSTINTVDEDAQEEKIKKKHKKSKKNKKNNRKDDQADESQERKRKKHHRKHKKEKKLKKERKEDIEKEQLKIKRKEEHKERGRAEGKDDRDERNVRDDKRKIRKRERQQEQFDNDEPRVKNRRDEEENKKTSNEKRDQDLEKERRENNKRKETAVGVGRKDIVDEINSNKSERTRRSVHDRLQKPDDIVASSPSSAVKQSTIPARKPVSFVVTSNKSASNIKSHRYSSSSSTKDHEEDEPSRETRQSKEETDLKSNSEKVKKLLLAMVSECGHEIVIKDMCATCGRDLREEGGRAGQRKEQSTANVSMIHHVPELIVSDSLARTIGSADETNLITNRKLVLLVDLDQTIIHTSDRPIHVDMEKNNDITKYNIQSRVYTTKLRPHTLEFLNKMSTMYEMHIVTYGQRLYAHKIADILDPNKRLFGQRILSRDELFSAQHKTRNLKALFPCGDNLVVIIDDRADVWMYSDALIQIKPYRFFKEIGDINAPKDSKELMPAEIESDAHEDQVLEEIGRVLTNIHEKYYERHDVRPGGDVLLDVKEIIREERHKVLDGCCIVFSGIVPLGEKLERTDIYRLCEQFGAKILLEITDEVTHVVAARFGTQKVHQACRLGKHVVSVQWVYSCVEKWMKADEKTHELTKESTPPVGRPLGSKYVNDLANMDTIGKAALAYMNSEVDEALSDEEDEDENEKEDAVGKEGAKTERDMKKPENGETISRKVGKKRKHCPEEEYDSGSESDDEEVKTPMSYKELVSRSRKEGRLVPKENEDIVRDVDDQNRHIAGELESSSDSDEEGNESPVSDDEEFEDMAAEIERHFSDN